MIIKLITKYLCCPICMCGLSVRANKIACSNCGREYSLKNDILEIIPDMSDDLKLSIKKWDEIYEKELKRKSYNNDYAYYEKSYLKDTYQQLNKAKLIDKKLVFLEIGCGPCFLAQAIAKQVKLVIGIDLCPAALKIAKKMFEDRGITNYLLIQGDILAMPIKQNKIDLIYGGCVVGHFKDTQSSVNELYRVLKPNGVSLNSFPMLDIGSLTYRQIWGNIPNIRILRPLAEFIHIKLLKSRYMIFGYEMSFLRSTLIKIHLRSGFRLVDVSRFKVNLSFDFLPIVIRKPFIYLATISSLFWPMIKVVAVK